MGAKIRLFKINSKPNEYVAIGKLSKIRNIKITLAEKINSVGKTE